MASKKEVVTVLRGDSKDIQEAFRKAGTDADQFREKVQRLNQLKLEAKVLKVDTNLSKAEAEIQSLTGSGGKLKGVIGELTQQFLPAGGAAGSFGDSLGAGTLAAGALAGGVGAMGMAVRASVTAFTDQAEAISKFQTITGTSAEQASDLVNALDDVGISGDTASAVFAKFAKTIPTEQFKQLGVEVKKTSDGSTDMVGTFGEVLKKLENTTDATERSKVANAAFGKSWTELTALIDKGSESFQKSLEANKGLRMTEADKQAARAYKASMDELGDSVKQLEIKAARVAMPFIQRGTDGLTRMIGFVDMLSDHIQKIPQPPGWLADAGKLSLGALMPGSQIWSSTSNAANEAALALSRVDAVIGQFGDTEAVTGEFRGLVNAMKDGVEVGGDFNGSLTDTTAKLHTLHVVQKSVAESMLDQMNAEDRSASAAGAVASARQRVADQQRAGAEAVRNAEQNLADVRAKAGDLADRTAGAEKNLEKARRDAKSAAEDVATAEAEFARIANGSTDATDELISATDALSRARESAAEAQQRAFDIELQISGQILDNRLNGPKRVDQANRDLIRSQNRVQDATDRVAQIEAELARMRDDGKSTTAEIARKERDLEEARLDISDATDRVTESQEKLTKAQERAADPAAGTEKLEKDLEKARRELRDRTTEVADAERVVGDLRNGYAPGTDVYRQAEEKVVAARQSLRDRTDEVKAKEKELFDARTTQAALPGQIATAEAALTGVIQAEAEKQRLAVESVNSALREQEKLRLGNQVAADTAAGGSAAQITDKPANRSPLNPVPGTTSMSGKTGAIKGKWGSVPSGLVTISLNGQKWQVAADTAPAFIGFLKDAQAQGLVSTGKITSSGGYNDRQIFINGKPTGRPSNHADGEAIDINAGDNPQGKKAQTIDPAKARALAAKWGLKWGGDFSTPDPMHFEATPIAKKIAKAQEDQANAAKGQLGSQKYMIGQGRDQLAALKFLADLGDGGNATLSDILDSIVGLPDDLASLLDGGSGGSAAPVHNPLYSVADAQAGVYARGPNGDGHPFARNPILGSTLYDENGNPIYADDVEAIQRALDRLPRAASGAFVPSRPGGQLYQVAEGGQDEIITPVPMMQRIVRDELRRDGSADRGTVIKSLTFAPVLPGVTDVDSFVRVATPKLLDEITRLQRRRG